MTRRYSSKSEIVADVNLPKIMDISGMPESANRAVQVSEEYTPADSDAVAWAGSAPTTQDEAIDKLAAFADSVEKTVQVIYNQSVDGDIPSSGLELGLSIPNGAIIIEVISEVGVAVTGGSDGVTVAVGALTISDSLTLTTGVEIANDTLGPVKVSTGDTVSLVSGGDSYTAGALELTIRYVVSNL